MRVETRKDRDDTETIGKNDQNHYYGNANQNHSERSPHANESSLCQKPMGKAYAGEDVERTSCDNTEQLASIQTS